MNNKDQQPLGVDEINKPLATSVARQDRFSRNRRSAPETSYWNEHLHGHIQGYWWLTALPQHFKRFRKSEPSVQLYLVKQRRGMEFCIRDENGTPHTVEGVLNIQHQPFTQEQQQKLWLQRDYSKLVAEYCVNEEQEVNYGEISFTERDENEEFSYNDQFGLVKAEKR